MRRLLLGAALAALLPTHAYGQENQTENEGIVLDYHLLDHSTVVSVGERIGHSDKHTLTSPSSLITEDEITNRGNAYVTDLLRTIAGVSVNRSGPAGGLTQLRLRGTEGNHVLVLVDGIEISNPNTGEFDFASLRARDVVKIEVLRGEQSSLWGSDAIGGVISIITKSRASQESYEVSIEGGSFGTREAQLSAVIPISTAALSINGSLFQTDGYDASGLNGEKDGAKNESINIGLNDVELSGVEFSGKFSASTAISEFDEDLTYNGRLENTEGETTTNTKTGRVSAQFDLAGFENLVNFSLTNTKQATQGTSFPNDTTGKRTQLNWAIEKSWDAHNFTVLAETEEEKFSNFGGVGAGQNQERSIRNNALAADYRYNDHNITLTASARQDFNDRFEDGATWRVGAGYAFETFGGRVRASYGTGVKNPGMTELFGYFPGSFIGNADVKPETSKGYSVGYDQTLEASTLGRFMLSVDYFRSDLENEITTIYNPNFTSTVANKTSDSKREGIELEAHWDIETLSARASATFLNTEESSDIQEVRRPEFLASGTLTWHPADSLSLTLSADHTGSQIDTDFGTYQRVNLDPFTLVGLNASWELNDTLSVSVRGENLLDEDYEEVVGYASQGRGLYAGLNAHF